MTINLSGGMLCFSILNSHQKKNHGTETMTTMITVINELKRTLADMRDALDEPMFSEKWTVKRTALWAVAIVLAAAVLLPQPATAEEMLYMAEGGGSRALLSDKPCTDKKMVAIINKYDPEQLKYFYEGRVYLAEDKKTYNVCWRYVGMTDPESGEVMIPMARVWAFEDEETGGAELSEFSAVPADTPINPNHTSL